MPLVAAALFGWIAALTPRPTLQAQPTSGRLAVATESDPASRQALGILRNGGNAVDAAVAAALIGGVPSPASSGIGGGGFALIWNQRGSQVTTLDFRETAPARLDVDAFERKPFAPGERGKLVGVPGELAGLFEMHRRFGRLPWRSLVEPAANLADAGFAVSPYVAKALGERSSLVSLDTGLTDLFFREGRPRKSGDRVKNPRLARTLRRVAREGIGAFYFGDIARDLVETAQRLGGSVTTEDLSRYRPVERPPLLVRWEGLDVYTMGLPSAGGLMLAQTLETLSRKDLRRFDPRSAGYQHYLAEILRGALADRIRFASDPTDTAVDTAHILDRGRMKRRKRVASPERTHPLPAFVSEEHGTHHIITADDAGNVVSLTTTINHGFGAGITTPRSGVLLNDELDDFTSTEAARKFGLERSPNRPRPGARPVSSMVPTIVVKDGRPVMAFGASGGFTIGPAAVQIFLSCLAFDLPPAEALALPRFEIPTDAHTIALEPSVSPQFADELRAFGEVPLMKQSVSTPAVQLMLFHEQKKSPFSDPRKQGVALSE